MHSTMALSGRTLLSGAGSQLCRTPRHPQAYQQLTRRGSTTSPPAPAPARGQGTSAAFSTSAAKLDAEDDAAATNNDKTPHKKQTDERAEVGRSDISTDRSEYTKSGTDSQIAGMESAYDLHNTTPESVREASSRESGKDKGNPLEVSPANREVSNFTDENGKGESVVHGPSRRVSPRKGKRVDYGGAAVERRSEQDTP